MGIDLFSFLDWEPDDESRGEPLELLMRAVEQARAGDTKTGLATIDDGLMSLGLGESTDDDLASLLLTKAALLTELCRPQEAFLLCQQVVDLADEGRTNVELHGAVARMYSAMLVAGQGATEEALQRLTDTAALFSAADEPQLRAVAAACLGYRVRELIEVGRLDEAREAWRSLCEAHGADPDPRVRTEVAEAGDVAARLFLHKRRAGLALETAEEVVALYRSEAIAKVRAAVAVAMCSRLAALRRRGRLIALSKAQRDLARFLGSDPEPVVVDRIRAALPRPQALFRSLRRYDS